MRQLYLQSCESETLVSCSNDDCQSCDESNDISLFSATPRGLNSAIIINDHPFAYPDCTFGEGIRPSELIKSW